MTSTTLDAQAIPSESFANAKISYDDSINGLTQPYAVTAGGIEVFRHATYAGCERFIIWHGYILQDEQAIAQAELDQLIEQQSHRVASRREEVAPEIEIDSDIDKQFGTLYRVWSSYHLLGTFYQSLDGAWISQPCNTMQRGNWATDTQAINAILAA